MEDQYKEIELKDGIRLPYNIFPIFKDNLPISALYTPNTETTHLEYSPPACGSCMAIINPFCEISHGSWNCIFCKKSNPVPQHYRNATDLLPIEMVETSVKYTIGNATDYTVILVDCSTFDAERHKLCVEAVKESLSILSTTRVCLVLFGTNIEIVIGRKRYLFSGKKESTREGLRALLSKSDKKASQDVLSSFFVPVEEFLLNENTMRADPFPVLAGARPLRCTGAAISFASALLPASAGRIILFTQGPCTFGPGTICSLSLKDGIRSHSDIVKGKATFASPASTFYNSLGVILSANGHTLDIFAATIEDIGLYEMRSMVEMTGGIVIMSQDFNRDIYLSSIKKALMGGSSLDCRLRVSTTSNLAFKGVLGQGSAHRTGWKLGAVYSNSTFSLLFEGVSPKTDDLAYIQIITQSQECGVVNVKVTTLARAFSTAADRVCAGFDQEAAAVLQARMFTSQAKIEEDLDLVRRIDRSLIKFMRRFASFSKEDSGSVILPDTMLFFPQFTYFLRRSVVAHSEANSPDETSYYRHILGRERVTEALTVIVPVLTSYHYVDGISPVDMDSRSMHPDTILLLDAFCNVLIWRGEHVNQWINEGLHEKEEYASLKKCIEEAEANAREIVEKRIPTPQFVITEAGGSQERILKCRVNPSKQGVTILTDDIDFETFYKCLCKIVVDG